MQPRLALRVALGLALLAAAGCDSNTSQPGIQGIPLPSPISSTIFPQNITTPNPLFPLVVGNSWRYVAATNAGEEVNLVEVTDRQKLVEGIATTVIRDRLWLDGELVEDTDDWYAQDEDGNIWYFGEDVKNYVNGQVANRRGSWEAGVDGAMAGVFMWAQPKVGTIYYQEYYEGEAEDVGEVLSLNETVNVSAGTFENCLKTEDTTPLEPDVIEYKYYCPGVGLVLEEDQTEAITSELTEYTVQ